jgi:anti-sigma regulatory factor (Ser/Thr protein kinase)
VAARTITASQCGPESAADARSWTNAHLTSLLTDARTRRQLIADAVLVVSELVTNAVTAGATGYTVLLQTTPRTLTITVTDDAPGEPTLLRPEPTSTHGRGLLIVDTLAATWGTSYVAALSKAVWAELSIA